MKEATLFERMYAVCADAITLATQLSQAPDLPAPEILRQRINSTFENLRHRAQQMDIPSADAMEAIYALAAFMDEQILRSPWPARQQWMAQPLQLAYFHETTAGEGFFQRLSGLEVDPSRTHVVQIYYLCLTLGFQGKFAVGHPGEWAAVIERTGNDLSRRLPGAGDVISPPAYPNRRQLAFNARQFPVVGAALAFAGVAVLIFIILLLTISFSASEAATRIRTTVATMSKVQ